MVISLKMYCNINIYMASFWNSHYSNHLQCLQVISNATTLPVDVVLQDSCHILIMYPLFHPFLDKAEQILVLGSLLNKKNELYFSQIRLQNQNQSLHLADIQIRLYF